jgi:hypothetical protein
MLSDISPSQTAILAVIRVLQSCIPVGDVNLLPLCITSFSFLRSNLHASNFRVSRLLTRIFPLNLLPPNIVQHHGQLLLLIIGMCDIRMLSLVYQDMIILTVSLPIRRGTIVFLNVSMWEHRVVDRFVDVALCTSLTLILLFSSILSFSFDSLKVYFLTNSAMKLSNRILVWYLGTDRISALFAHWRCPVSHLFYPPLWYTRIKHQC